MPRVAVVMPAWQGGYCWNFCEGWLRALNDLAIPHTAFQVPDDEEVIRACFRDLKKLGADVAIISCGDHHLPYLHNAEWKRAFWQELRIPVLCFCNERIINGPFPGSEDRTKSAISAFDAFLYVDEFAGQLFRASRKPSMWVSQFADDTLFLSNRDFESRNSLLYFRAQLSNFGIPGVYADRRALIEAIGKHDCFDIHDGLLPPVEFAKDLEGQRFVLRAPSNCPGWVENFWTAIAAGCVVFHQALPAEETASRALLIPGEHYMEYDISKPDALVAQAVDAVKNWGDYRSIARRAQSLFQEKYTIRHFIKNALDFMESEGMVKT